MLNKNFKKYFSIFLIFSVLFVCTGVFAPVLVYGDGDDTGAATLENPIKHNTIQDFIKAVLEQVAIIGSMVVVFFMIYSGFLFVSARGNEEKLTKAKWAFFGAVVGGILVIGAWAIAVMIKGTVDRILG